MSSEQPNFQQLLRQAERELKSGFKKFDIDSSGSLSKNQFAQLMKRVTGAFNVEDPSLTDIDQLMGAVDIDGDGRITQEEFDELVGDIINIIREEVQFERLNRK